MKWISVKERLPEEGQDILVICDYRNAVVFSGFFREGEFVYSNNGFYYAHKASAKSLRNGLVTHWIPEPKFEGDEE